MKIGQVSAASGCQIETIRYYERIGLLRAPSRTQTGYRQYTRDDVDRLRFVTRGRALGFSLDEIESLLGLAEEDGLACDDVDRIARAHLADVQRRVADLRRIQVELERTIKRCKGGERAQCSILGALRDAG
ncbi:MerR family transcriptional regulator [Lysobacter humi (ex Lee et al. 2017)]